MNGFERWSADWPWLWSGLSFGFESGVLWAFDASAVVVMSSAVMSLLRVRICMTSTGWGSARQLDCEGVWERCVERFRLRCLLGRAQQLRCGCGRVCARLGERILRVRGTRRVEGVGLGVHRRRFDLYATWFWRRLRRRVMGHRRVLCRDLCR